MRGLVVCGIGTGVGKTVVSSILIHLLKARYFKPVSCGRDRDTTTIRSLLPKTYIYPECYHFLHELSPNIAADLDGATINSETIIPPISSDTLIIEMAGGVYVPINKTHLLIDIVCNWNYPFILTSRHYLGSINHTLLSIHALQSRNAHILGIIYVGPPNPQTENSISQFTSIPTIGHIGIEESINTKTIMEYSNLWRQQPFWKSLML